MLARSTPGKRGEPFLEGAIKVLRAGLIVTGEAGVDFEEDSLELVASPVSTWAALPAPRMKSAAGVSSASEKAI